MSTRQSIERQELERERRAAERERNMSRRVNRCAKHLSADGRITRSAHVAKTALTTVS